MVRTLLFGLLVLSLPASLQVARAAQDPEPPTGHEGTLVSFDDQRVTLQEADGQAVTVAMTPGWTVSVVRPADNRVIQPGDFVASANTVVDAATGHSTELRILEPGYRPEQGTHPTAPGSATLMTHGSVQAVEAGTGEVVLTITYPGGGRRLIVPDGVKVTRSDPLARSVLQPGMRISLVTRRGADGVARAGRVTLAHQPG